MTPWYDLGGPGLAVLAFAIGWWRFVAAWAHAPPTDDELHEYDGLRHIARVR